METKNEALNRNPAPIAYYILNATNTGGTLIEVYGILFGTSYDRIRWKESGKIQSHLSQINSDFYGMDYFNAFGSRVYLNDCVRY